MRHGMAMGDHERYLELSLIQSEALLSESEIEEWIAISTRILYNMLEDDSNREILERLRNR